MHYKKNIIYEINQIQTLGKKSYRTFSAVFVATSPGRETMRTVGFKNSIFWHMTYDDHIKLLFILQLNFHKVPLERLILIFLYGIILSFLKSTIILFSVIHLFRLESSSHTRTLPCIIQFLYNIYHKYTVFV